MAATRTGIALTVVALAAFVRARVPHERRPARRRPGRRSLPRHAKKKKRKAIRCRKSEVPIKVRRRTVGCRKRRAALPRPRAGDQRLLLAKAALDDDLRALRDRRHRRPPSLKKLFRKVGPRAYRTVQRAIPQGFARLDGLVATGPVASSVARDAARAPELRKVRGGPLPTRTDTFTSSSGGQKLTGTVSLGRVGTFDLTLEGRSAYGISVGITTDECDGFDAPSCPTAAGVVDATDSSSYRVSLEGRQGRHPRS